MAEEARWYVAHTYSGYEQKVKDNLEKTVENRGMREVIQETRIPVEEAIEVKNGKRHIVKRKVYPGYVMVKMVMTDESWYVVRNTRGVTGFVGSGTKPIPLTQEEVDTMGVDRTAVRFAFAVGDLVRITSGPLNEFNGNIDAIDYDKHKVRVVVSMFGRDTRVELDFDEVSKP